jgi:hypothetical protein
MKQLTRQRWQRPINTLLRRLPLTPLPPPPRLALVEHWHTSPCDLNMTWLKTSTSGT